MNKSIQIVDLFCGGGGLSQGFINAGLDVVAAFDKWPEALDFYRRNIPGHDVIELDLADVSKSISTIVEHEPDLIAGGPPCQDFSSAGKRDETGTKANLTLSFASIIEALRPRFFVMENVDRARKTKTFAQAIEMFKNSNYGITETVLNASLCGVPQRRKRVMVIGIQDVQHNTLIPIIKQKQSAKPMTVRDYLGEKLGIDHYYRHPRSYQRRGIFSIDEPSPTVRGVNRPLPNGYPGHHGDTAAISDQIRALTSKERSLIQTFPDSWDISGKKSVIEQIIGNAVPVKLAEFVANCLLEYLKNPSTYNIPIDRHGNCRLFEQKVRYRSKSGKVQELATA